MALNEEQARRLNNLVSAAKQLIPEVIGAMDGLENLEATYAAFQASGLVAADIVDSDFQGDNEYVSEVSWEDFVFAVGTFNNAFDNVRTAFLAMLDTVPL